MLRAEYRQAQADIEAHVGAIMQAAQKCGSGDVRGARVRLESALETLRRVEADCCNPMGYLTDPGDDEINGNKPGATR